MNRKKAILTAVLCAVLCGVGLVAAAQSFTGALAETIKMIKIKDHSGAGTSTITSIAVDTAGYKGALFRTSFGTAAVGNYIKVQESSDDGATDAYADLAGTKVDSGASDEDVWVEIVQPHERYLKLLAVPGTSSTVESMWADLYGGRTLPEDNTTTGTITGKIDPSPAEGTP